MARVLSVVLAAAVLGAVAALPAPATRKVGNFTLPSSPFGPDVSSYQVCSGFSPFLGWGVSRSMILLR